MGQRGPTGTVHAATIIARNYLPYARVLVASFREQHPDGEMAVLVIDDTGHAVHDIDGAAVVRVEDLLDEPEVHRLAMIYEVMELATAMKPFLLRHLLGRGWPHAVYLDADMRLYAPIDDLAALAETHQAVLTPHTTEPIARDDCNPSELEILASGVYNLGFLAVGAGSDGLLDFWAERLRRDCITDHGRMLFADQRWIDLAPGYFPHHIVRDPTVNVAYWNLDRRPLRWTGARYEIGDRPLRLFHFSGFDPARPAQLTKYQGARPRVEQRDHPALARLCGEYHDELLAAGWVDPARAVPYAYNRLPSGRPIDRRLRRLYRTALLAAEAGDGSEPPDPFAPATADRFVAWMKAPSRPGLPPGVSRYLEAVHEDRHDVCAAMPDLDGADGERFVEWVVHTGQFEEHIPPDLVPEVASPPAGAATRPPSSAGDDAFERVVGLAARPPGGEEPSQYRWLGHAARQAVLRLTRPYWYGQQKLNEALADLARAERDDRRTRDEELARLRAELAAAQRTVDALRRELQAALERGGLGPTD